MKHKVSKQYEKENEFMNTKMKRRMLSLLLCFVVLVGLMPTTALAVTTVNTINITGITAPVAGEAPVITGITTDTAGITLGEIQWLKPGGVIMQSTDKFEAGVEYLLKIKYTVDTDYKLSDTATVTSDSGHDSSNVDYVNTAVRLNYKVPVAAKYTVTVTGGTVSLRTPIPGEDVTSVSTEAGNRLLLKAPAVSGKRFTGWSGLGGVTLCGDNAKVTDSSLQFIMPAKNLTVTANYQDAVEITTINIKGITKPLAGANPVTSGITTDTTGLSVEDAIWYFNKIPATSVAHDYEFQLDDKIKLSIFLDVADGYTYADPVTITADLEYTAAYRINDTVYLEYTVTKEMPTTYTVSFDANDGTGTMTPATGVSGEYELPACTFTAPSGKQFKAWSVGGVEKAVGDKITVTADTTVTAVWKDVPVTTYTITFNANGASVTPASAETNAEGKLTSLPTPTRSGSYSFNGWYTAASGGTKVTTSTVFNTDATIYAQWTYTGSSGSGSGGGYIPTIQNPTITSGEGVKVTLSADGTVATIKVDAGYELVDVVLNGTSKGKVTEVKGLKTGDKLVVTAAKKAPESAEPTAEEIIATLADHKLAARSKVVTMKNGKKAVRITWYNRNGEMMEFDGVEIFRSTKKNSGYGKKPIFTSETGKYYNTAIKAGTKYYYKLRGYVVIDGQKYYTDYSLKAIRTVK